MLQVFASNQPFLPSFLLRFHCLSYAPADPFSPHHPCFEILTRQVLFQSRMGEVVGVTPSRQSNSPFYHRFRFASIASRMPLQNLSCQNTSNQPFLPSFPLRFHRLSYAPTEPFLPPSPLLRNSHKTSLIPIAHGQSCWGYRLPLTQSAGVNAP